MIHACVIGGENQSVVAAATPAAVGGGEPVKGGARAVHDNALGADFRRRWFVGRQEEPGEGGLPLEEREGEEEVGGGSGSSVTP